MFLDTLWQCAWYSSDAVELCTVQYKINNTNPPYTITHMVVHGSISSWFIALQLYNQKKYISLEKFRGYKSIRENRESFRVYI